MTELKPRFVAGAGFDGTGAIIEADGETEFIRATYCTVIFDLIIENSSIIYSKDLLSGNDEPDVLTEDDREILRFRGLEADAPFHLQLRKQLQRREVICATAKVAKFKDLRRSNGYYAFSAFGSEKSFHELTVGIFRKEVSRCSVYHIRDDWETRSREGFGIDLSLDEAAFDNFVLLLAKEQSQFRLAVTLDDPCFFADWSPAVNEGRLIKYLGDPQVALENPDDLPDHFKSKGPMSLRFRLWLIQNYKVDKLPDEQEAWDDVARDVPKPDEPTITDQLLRVIHASNVSLRSSIFGASLTIAAAILVGSWIFY